MDKNTRKNIIVGNWKMNKGGVSEAAVFVSALANAVLPTDRLTAIAPPFTALSVAAACLHQAQSSILLAAQNVHSEPSGAYTGEVSALMLAEVGCRLVIIGHSERRALFGETDIFINAKIHTALAAGLTPIICVGETLAQRQQDKAFATVQEQLLGALLGVNGNVVIAYEPVWAIGTGQTASPTTAQEMHGFIRGWLAKKYGLDVANTMSILYGGSVKPKNMAALMTQADIDGALVGGASLDLDDFLKIIHY